MSVSGGKQPCRAVGGAVSKPTLKGADTSERPWDVYTAGK